MSRLVVSGDTCDPIDVRQEMMPFNLLQLGYFPIHRSQIAAVHPHMALNTTTNRGVSRPRSTPIMPLLAFIGKITKSCTRVGPRLKINPRDQMRVFNIGRRNNNPQMPPHTSRGYSHAGESCGEIFTPRAAVIPRSPKIQTARLLSKPPKQPAANTRLVFLAKLRN